MLSAWLNWDFVLTRSGVPALIGADRGRAAGSFHRDGDIGIAETSEAEAALQRRALIAEGWGCAAFEMNAGSVSNAGSDESGSRGEGECF